MYIMQEVIQATPYYIDRPTRVLSAYLGHSQNGVVVWRGLGIPVGQACRTQAVTRVAALLWGQLALEHGLQCIHGGACTKS
jgi:hypothetical protein